MISGLALGTFGLGLVDINVDGEAIKRIAEITLAVVLFSDSAGSNLPVLLRGKRLPGRLLLIGLPLTIGLGYALGSQIYSDATWLQLALVATMLAPTDAALGKAVVSNQAVPATVREGLNVESGLNDGICVPVLLLFLSFAGDPAGGSVGQQMVHLMLEEIGIGLMVGIPFAFIGASLLTASIRREWISGTLDADPDGRTGPTLFCYGSVDGGERVHCIVCWRFDVRSAYPPTKRDSLGGRRANRRCAVDDHLVHVRRRVHW